MKFIRIFEKYKSESISDEEYEKYFETKIPMTDQEISDIKGFFEPYLIKYPKDSFTSSFFQNYKEDKKKPGKERPNYNYISVEIPRLDLHIFKITDEWFIVNCEFRTTKNGGWEEASGKCDELGGLFEFLEKTLISFPKWNPKLEVWRRELVRLVNQMSDEELLRIKKFMKK